MQLKMATAFSFIPVDVLLRLDGVEDSTGEASRGKVKVDAVHPGVFVQLQHFLFDLMDGMDKSSSLYSHILRKSRVSFERDGSG